MNTEQMLFGKEQIYYVEYTYGLATYHCQIQASSEQQCRLIFAYKFDNGCMIKKIETTEDIADNISNKMIEIVKKQLGTIQNQTQ
jgi:hypothetical protein